MAVAYIQEFPIADRSTRNYDFVADKIGDGPFDGLIAHTAGFDDEAGVFRIFDVWETREQAERFLAEHVQPLVEQISVCAHPIALILIALNLLRLPQ